MKGEERVIPLQEALKGDINSAEEKALHEKKLKEDAVRGREYPFLSLDLFAPFSLLSL